MMFLCQSGIHLLDRKIKYLHEVYSITCHCGRQALPLEPETKTKSLEIERPSKRGD